MNGSQVSRIRTGFEELVAHRTRPPFAYPAEDDGVIESIDKDAGVLVVKYKNGTKECVKFGEEFTNNTSNGFYVNQSVVINGFKKGDKVRKGDIITYNKEFFQADPYDKRTVRYKIGVLADVAIMDCGGTIEDASILTKPIAEKMRFNPVHVNQVVITIDTNVRSFAKIGDNVYSTDPVIVFDEAPFDPGGEDDPEILDALSKINQFAPKAGHTGTIVQIDALYKSPLSQMSPSLRKLIKYATEKKDAQADRAKGCVNAGDFMKSDTLDATTKIGLVDLTPETVILRFYIKQDKSMNVGDKLIFGNQLKSVASQVLPDYIEAEDGTKVGAVTSGRGIMQRIINSPALVGISNRVLEKLEKDVLEMWFGNDKS